MNTTANTTANFSFNVVQSADCINNVFVHVVYCTGEAVNYTIAQAEGLTEWYYAHSTRLGAAYRVTPTAEGITRCISLLFEYCLENNTELLLNLGQN